MKIANTEIPYNCRYITTTSEWECLTGAYRNLYFVVLMPSGGIVNSEKDVRYSNKRFGLYDMFFKKI